MTERKLSYQTLGLPNLSSASETRIEVRKDYESGAFFKGEIKDDLKCGRGTFVWPNGIQFEGEFKDNVRCGSGVQSWPDGSLYKGEFMNDLRHGQGQQQWPNGESYEGNFYKDKRHGWGRYTWPDGSSYDGLFFMNRREGYGSFISQGEAKFDGLYKNDERFGPGVQTYINGDQDVGLWERERLVKILSSIKGSFSIKDHEEYDYLPEDHFIFIDDICNTDEIEKNPDVLGLKCPISETRVPNIDDYEIHYSQYALRNTRTPYEEQRREISAKNMHLDAQLSSDSIKTDQNCAKSDVLESEMSNVSLKSDNVKKSRGSSRKSRSPEKKSRSSTREQKEKKKILNRIIAWNRTNTLIKMQKHILKHKPYQHNATFNVGKLLSFKREGYCQQGSLEKASEEFIIAAMSGDEKIIDTLLSAKKVHPDVADVSGFTALIGAAINWRPEVINILLDAGANVNKVTDEGVSALAACHVYFYPSDTFKPNIAEKIFSELPEDFPREQGYDPYEAVKNMLHAQQMEKRKELSIMIEKTHNESLTPLQRKRIDRYRKEYEEVKFPEIESPTPSLVQQMGVDNGLLHVNRAEKLNVEEILAITEDDLAAIEYGKNKYESTEGEVERTSQAQSPPIIEEFESGNSIKNLPIEITDEMIDKYATELHSNSMVVDRNRSAASGKESLGTVRRLAIERAEHDMMEETIRLLLKRGADPNSSNVPWPVIFFAIKAADVEAVRLLLLCGASTSEKLPEQKGGLAPLHIAAALPGEEGELITELLLDALADPDTRAAEDDSFLNTTLEDEWMKDRISEDSLQKLGGRTALHIACAREDNYRVSSRIVQLLLQHHADPNLLVNGHSPLALAIISGNDAAIYELLRKGADPNLTLTHGVGTALCVATATDHENRRTPRERLKLIDKLVASGADILAPIPVGPRRSLGTAVDYAYYNFNLDRRIAHMPYHALNPAERLIYNSRRELLAHIGSVLRLKAVEREKRKIEEEQRSGDTSSSPSRNFVYTASGRHLPPGMKGKGGRLVPAGDSDGDHTHKERDGIIVIDARDGTPLSSVLARHARKTTKIRKALFKYCYECGRSVGVKLTACTRCKEVFYCSKVCKMKAWNARHKEECIRVGGISQSPNMAKGKGRIDSPTPATDANKGKVPLKQLMDPRAIRKDQKKRESIITFEDDKMKQVLKAPPVGYGSSNNTRMKEGLSGMKRNLLEQIFGEKAVAKMLKAGGKNFNFADFQGGFVRDPETGRIVWVDNYSWV